MSWKRCDGCTRAIPEAADTCDYCGQTVEDSLAFLRSERDHEPKLEFDHNALAELSSVDDVLSAVAPPLAVEMPQPVETPAEVAPASVPAAVPAAASAPVSAAVSGLGPTPAQVPTPKPKAAVRLRPRDMAAIATGIVVGGGLIVTLLSSGSAASPEAPVAPVQPAKKPAAAVRSQPAPVPATAAATAAAPARVTPPPVMENAPHWGPAEAGRWLPASPQEPGDRSTGRQQDPHLDA
jgi:hypothetical protein